MPRYFFHIHNGQEIPDESGTVFLGVKECEGFWHFEKNIGRIS